MDINKRFDQIEKRKKELLNKIPEMNGQCRIDAINEFNSLSKEQCHIVNILCAFDGIPLMYPDISNE